jgi:hypothetical protein
MIVLKERKFQQFVRTLARRAPLTEVAARKFDALRRPLRSTSSVLKDLPYRDNLECVCVSTAYKPKRLYACGGLDMQPSLS